MPQIAQWVIGAKFCSIAKWVNGTDLCSTSHWSIGSKDCPTAYWVMRTDLNPNVKCVQWEGALQAHFLETRSKNRWGRKATRHLNMMAKHKNAPALGQGAEESRAASGQSTEPLG